MIIYIDNKPYWIHQSATSCNKSTILPCFLSNVSSLQGIHGNTSGKSYVTILAAIKRLYKCPSVCPSITSVSLCSHHCIIMEFSGVITIDRSDVHAKGQGQRLSMPSMVSVAEPTPLSSSSLMSLSFTVWVWVGGVCFASSVYLLGAWSFSSSCWFSRSGFVVWLSNEPMVLLFVRVYCCCFVVVSCLAVWPRLCCFQRWHRSFPPFIAHLRLEWCKVLGGSGSAFLVGSVLITGYRNWPRYGLRRSGWYCNPAQHHDSADRISGQFLFYHDHNFSKSKGNLRFQLFVPLFVPIGVYVTTHDDGTASDVTIGMWRRNQQATNHERNGKPWFSFPK